MALAQGFEEVKKMNKPKILIPIHPEWCERIFNGEKTIEVRKTRPKIDTPFEVLVYCTMPKERWSVGHQIFHNDTLYTLPTGELKTGDALELRADWLGKYNEDNFLNGKVIGSFVCDKVDEYSFSNLEARYRINDVDLAKTCLNHPELIAYGKGKTLRGLHITEPKLFNRPMELSEFGTICKKHGDDRCNDCLYLRVSAYDDCVDTWCGVGNVKPLTRVPQSWIYVETV